MTTELTALMAAVLFGGMIAFSAISSATQTHIDNAFQSITVGQDRPADFSARFIKVGE